MLLMHIKMNVDQEHDVIFKQAVRIADLFKVESNILRVAKKQICWDNVPADLPEDYYIGYEEYFTNWWLIYFWNDTLL